MNAIDKFAETLTSTGHDDLIMVLQSMSDGMYKARSAEIDGLLSSIIAEINKVNEKRSQLSAQKALLERLLKKIDIYAKSNNADLELELFRLHLSNQLDKLKVRIAETRPDDALKRKHDLTQERILLDAGRKIAIEVMKRVAKMRSTS